MVVGSTMNMSCGVILACAVTVAACGKSSTDSGDKAVDPNSGYAKLRPAILKGVTEFPSDPATLARCSPALTGVVVMTRSEAARALKTPAGAGTGFGAALRTYYGGHLEALERGEVESIHLSWFENVSHLALFEPVVATAPTMTGCEHQPETAGARIKIARCTLTQGVVDGNVVVYDPSGRPTCALKLRIDGPFVVAGSYGVEADTTGFVGDVLTKLFGVNGKAAPSRQFLDGLTRGRSYKVTVDGAVLVEPAH